MKRSIILIFISIIYILDTQAQETPKYSNEFLSIGVGARALGMSNSHVAITDDVDAGYWNPAGLVDLKPTYQGTLMHAEYFAGIAKYDYAAFATKIDSLSTLGFSIIRIAVDDIPDTRFLYDANGAINYDNIRFFSSADYAFLFSYARRMPQLANLKIGGNVKIIHRVVGDFANAWGFGLDAGAQMNIGKYKLGATLRDVTGTFNAWNHNVALIQDIYSQTNNEIPSNTLEITLPKLILGAARNFNLNDNFNLLTSFDFVTSFDGERNVLIKSPLISLDPVIGFECGYKDIVYLRTGMGNIQRLKSFDGSTYATFQMNFGIGICIDQITIDYALTDIGDQSAGLFSHVFSLKASFE